MTTATTEGTPTTGTTGHGRRRVGLTTFAAIVACSAFGGTIGLATGVLDLGHTIDQRLPLHSPVLGGLALALVVGLPVAVVAVAAWQRDPRTDLSSFVAGGLLITWIVVEVAIIRELSFLQPFFAVVGACFVLIGRRSLRAPASARAVPAP